MLNSYFEEVARKRRNNTFFWIIVFLGASALYFFFKGYYISFNINLGIFTESGTTESNTGKEIASINSFGIIHVKSIPNDATILLNDEKKFANGEKFFTDYGNYSLQISRDGYKTGNMDFSINSESNFYIDTVSLLKNPDYKPSETLNDSTIIAIDENQWISHSSSGMLLFHENFNSGTLISQDKIFDHIGDNKFLSGSQIIEYNLLAKNWIHKGTPEQEKFLKLCPTARFQKSVLYCEQNQTAISEAGKIFTGILSHSNNSLILQDSIFLGNFEESTPKNFATEKSFTGKLFLEIENEWYTHSGGILTAVSPENKNILPEIFDTKLDSLNFMKKIGDTYFFIGKKDEKNFVTIIDPNGQHKTRTLPFPEIELAEIRIYEKNHNFFIKTRNSLLFLYHEGNEILWIIDGKILAIGKDFAIYEKEGKIWEAHWKDKKS